MYLLAAALPLGSLLSHIAWFPFSPLSPVFLLSLPVPLLSYLSFRLLSLRGLISGFFSDEGRHSCLSFPNTGFIFISMHSAPSTAATSLYKHIGVFNIGIFLVTNGHQERENSAL